MRHSFAFLAVVVLMGVLASVGSSVSSAQSPGGGCRQGGGPPQGMMAGSSMMNGGMSGGASSYQQMQMAYQYELMRQTAYLQQNSQYQQAALREKELEHAQQERLEQRKVAAREKRQAAEVARREKAKERNAQLPKLHKKNDPAKSQRTSAQAT